MPRPAAGQGADGPAAGYVVEELTTDVSFEADGRGSVRRHARVAITSEAGVQALGLLTFSYSGQTESFRLKSVRVEKPDGRVLEPPEEAIQERAAAVEPEMAVYTDLREVHVAVPHLRPGDTLEYETEAIVEQPLAPGIWWEHAFDRAEVVEREVLAVRVPAASSIRLWQEAPYEAEVTETARHRVYRWSASNPEPLEAEALQEALTRAPEIQLSSFESWSAVGAWYHGLAAAEARPVPAVRAKALELTAGKELPLDRVQALYRFVASRIRYVSLSLGIGRYRPHPAAEVLRRGYGDCKDKHTLLAALLAAVGLESNAVLVHTWRELTEEVPSPAQFDHLISAVRVGDETLWLDTTSQVAPFGLLSPGLRGQRALRVAAGGRSALKTVPVAAPFDPFFRTRFDGRLTALGDLRGSVVLEARGDVELVLRSAFLPTPRSGRAELAQWLLSAQGLGGEISNLRVTEPMVTDVPFRLEGDLRIRPPDGGGRSDRLAPPLATISLPDWAPAAEGEALELGEGLEVATTATISLPPGVEARAPLDVDLERGFGSYRSRYEVEEGVIVGSRSLRVESLAVPAAERPSYESFLRTIAGDREQAFTLDWRRAEAVDPSGVDDPEVLARAAQTAIGAERYGEAVAWLERLQSLDPEHATAWLQLALAYTQLGRLAEAEKLLRGRLDGEPAGSAGHRLLGEVLLQQGRAGEAVDELRRWADAVPLDASGWSSLGVALYAELRFAEAIDALERALALEPEDGRALAVLGACYLSVERTDEGVEMLLRARGTTDQKVLESVAEVALDHRQSSVARQLLRRLTGLDPNHPRAWLSLAMAQATEGSNDLALESVGRHLEIAPGDERARTLRLILSGEAGEAIDRAAGIAGLDERARAGALIQTARQHLARRQEEEGKELITRALELSDDEMIQASAAHLLAHWRLDLPRAEELAIAALERLATRCSSLSLEDAPAVAEQLLAALGRAWFTVGWVAFMNTDLDRALEYLEPTLWLAPLAMTAETIAQIYELREDETAARKFFALALALPGEVPSARRSLTSLVGEEGLHEAISRAREARRRRLQIELDSDGWTGEADVLLRLDRSGALLAARPLSGDPRVERTLTRATGESFTLSVPGGSPEAFLVRGVLRCPKAGERCGLSLVRPMLGVGG